MTQRICPQCSIPIVGWAQKIWCSPHCRNRDPEIKRRQAERQRTKTGGTARVALPAACVETDCSDTPIARDRCQRHYRAVRRAEGAAWALQGGGRHGHKGRAKLHNVDYEPVDRLRVMERDNWVCGICYDPIDPNAQYPDLLSPSLDHVLPLSRGGAHTYANTQASHLGCNLMKRDHLAG